MEISAINLQGPVFSEDYELGNIEQRTDSIAKEVFAEFPRVVGHELPRVVNASFPRVVNSEFPRVVNSAFPRVVGLTTLGY